MAATVADRSSLAPQRCSDPTETLLEFMESTYQAAAKSAGWDIEELRTHLPAREAVKLRRGN